MGSTQFGNFHNFCRDSTLPICNLFQESYNKATDGVYGPGFGRCNLTGIPLMNGLFLRNLGTIILAFIAILTATLLILRSDRKRAAVGRREMQLFLLGYIIIEICEIFTVGGFPLSSRVRIVSSTLDASLARSLTCSGLYRRTHWRNNGHPLGSCLEFSRRLPID